MPLEGSSSTARRIWLRSAVTVAALTADVWRTVRSAADRARVSAAVRAVSTEGAVEDEVEVVQVVVRLISHPVS